ncbi:serine/threonine-protein kinase [Tahibacter aquaticus]|uniref:Serine/threonine-protein kinase n=1 Tax=Tahibacter aquaticus TaxID=520092 RepID=A0A4V3DKM8_9GAMM|nr:serine/threonine-protein kinase [Tahibacter aquaticus]TDR35360.1 serine/threonine-protein kinase [Tahibacter aquaticus]
MSLPATQFRRVCDLFDAVVDLPLAQQTNRLRELCDDPALCAEVEALLRADAQGGAFDAAARAQRDRLAQDDDGADVDAVATNAAPAWRVVREAGRGGMGIVYLVERGTGELRQRGALKVLHRSGDSVVALARFDRERRVLAQLDHPAIARLLETGLREDGAPYLVMDYVDGEPIDRYVAQRKLGLGERLLLFLDVCAAVAHAHRQLVVHRDIKPANVLVTEEGRVKLLDFGIAKLLDDSAGTDLTRTQGEPLTPRYAAPEQLSGGPITTATDVYGLGGLFYLLLTDHAPRGADWRPEHGAYADDTFVAPSRRVEPQRARALRGDLDVIALCALQPLPERRYASVEAFAEDVRRHRDGRPIVVRRSSRRYLAGRFIARHRLWLGALLAVLVVSIAAAAISMRQARLARESAEHAEAVRHFVVGVFAQASPDENNGQPFTAHQLLDRGARQVAELAATPAVQADLMNVLAGLYSDLGDYARARTMATQAIERDKTDAVPADVRARSLLVLAQVETELRDFAAAAAHVEAARALAQRAGADEEEQRARRLGVAALVAAENYQRADPELRALMADDRARFGDSSAAVAEDWMLLGKILDNNARGDEAIAAIRQALRILQELPHAASARIDAQNRLGLMLLHKHDLSGADAVLKTAEESATRLYGADNIQTWTIRSNRIRAAEIAGRFEQAAESRNALLRVEREALNGSNPAQIASHAKFLAADYRELGRFAEAEALFRESLALSDRAAGAERGNDSADTLLHLGYTLQLRGRYSEAETAIREAYRIASQHEQPTSQWLNDTRGRLGNLLRLEGRYAEALAELRPATEALGQVGSGGNSILANLLAQLSLAELDGGDAATADTTATRATELARRVFEPGNYRLGLSLFAAARAKLALGRADAAVPLLREALSVRRPPHPAHDPRVLEVQVALVTALEATDRLREAGEIRAAIQPRLRSDDSPYARQLLGQLVPR